MFLKTACSVPPVAKRLDYNELCKHWNISRTLHVQQRRFIAVQSFNIAE